MTPEWLKGWRSEALLWVLSCFESLPGWTPKNHFLSTQSQCFRCLGSLRLWGLQEVGQVATRPSWPSKTQSRLWEDHLLRPDANCCRMCLGRKCFTEGLWPPKSHFVKKVQTRSSPLTTDCHKSGVVLANQNQTKADSRPSLRQRGVILNSERLSWNRLGESTRAPQTRKLPRFQQSFPCVCQGKHSECTTTWPVSANRLTNRNRPLFGLVSRNDSWTNMLEQWVLATFTGTESCKFSTNSHFQYFADSKSQGSASLSSLQKGPTQAHACNELNQTLLFDVLLLTAWQRHDWQWPAMPKTPHHTPWGWFKY